MPELCEKTGNLEKLFERPLEEHREGGLEKIEAVWKSLSEKKSEIESAVKLFQNAKRNLKIESSYLLNKMRGVKGEEARLLNINAIQKEIFSEEESKIHISFINACALFKKLSVEVSEIT